MGTRVETSAELVVIQGCMFAGKTGRLIDLLLAARDAGQRVRAFKHQCDTRYSVTELHTHDGRKFPAQPAASAQELAGAVGDAELIGVDEAQFFGRELVDVCHALVEAGCTVIAAGIHHDAWGQDFVPLPLLAAAADEVVTLTSPCGLCGQPAEYTERVVPLEGGSIIGGAKEFEPRCAACFHSLPDPKPVY